MSASADCVILTRFNLPSQGLESLIRAQEGWLRNRWALFEEYCLPSVLGQSDRLLWWLVYFDPESPDWLLERVSPHVESETFRAIYRETVPVPELVADLRAAIGPGRSPDLITVNLDNDDALASDFVERLRQVDPVPGGAAIYFENGLIRSPTRLYLRRDPVNAFCSVREPWDQPRTCWADWHNLLGKHMPVVVIDGPPAWLQVVHGQNVSNRVRGRLAQPTVHRHRFPGALDDLANPRPGERARDVLVARPARFARETVRAGIKRTLMRVLGREGWDKAKHRWRALVSSS